MKLVSSKSTFFLKKVLPVLWFGFIMLFIGIAATSGALENDAMLLIGPSIMTVVGFFLFKKLILVLVDEVYDCGGYLLVKRGDDEESIPLKNIMNVSVSSNTNPPKITLRLVNPSLRFGTEVVFYPQVPFTFNAFKRIEIAEDLIVRAYKARSGRAV